MTDVPGAPGADRPSLSAALFSRRVVRLWGPLDDHAVNQASAELMTLDATGDGPVQLFITSSGGPLHLAMSLVGTLDLLGVPVHVVCLGRVEGAATVVVGAAARRTAGPHAQFYLGAPEASASGNATQVAVWAEQHRLELERFTDRLAQACGRHREHVEADVAQGRWLDAQGALQYGLIDEIWPERSGPGRSGTERSGTERSGTDSPGVEGPVTRRRPFGFGPPSGDR